MDWLKYKYALSRNCQTSRFGYKAYGDLTKPKVVGHLSQESSFDLGTLNRTRRENIFVVASNTRDKSSIHLKLKWRPHADTSKLVTCISELKLTVNGSCFEFDQTETYEPSDSTVWPTRIMQVGSKGSNLKFFISRPYLRMRILFRGHMKSRANPNENSFVRLNLVLTCVANIFDFKHKVNEECFKTMYKARKLTKSIDQALTDLYLVDRHEEPVKVSGDVSINNSPKSQISNWGYFIKHFLDDKSPTLSTKRILSYGANGQLCHVGNNQLGQDQIDYGFTCFEIPSWTLPIDKPPSVDWNKVDRGTQELEFDVSGQGKTLRCKATKRQDFSPFYDLEMDHRQGWAIIEIDDNIDTQEDIENIEKSRAEFEENMKQNRIACSPDVDVAADKLLVVSLKDDNCSSSELVGSKASSLAQLTKYSALAQNSYTVPGGLVLTRHAYDAILEANPALIKEAEKLEQLVASGDLSSLKEACESAQQLSNEAKLPEKLKQELGDKLKQSYGEEAGSIAFAVRSSSWGEDEEDMSAAGQLTTILNVRSVQAVLDAIIKCFASKFTYSNIEYKRQHGLPFTLPMAVVVQEMVQCDKAGVMFTCNPTTGDDSELVITANYGLGESVVSGQAEPDMITLKKNPDLKLTVKEVKVGEKKIVIGPQEVDRSKCCLSDEEMLKLAECGLEIAKYYRCQRDIEWGYKEAQLFLFQSRPVTGLDGYTETELAHEFDTTSRAEREYCSRANWEEVAPFALKPLSLTYTVHFWNIMGYRFYTRFLSNPEEFNPGCMEEVMYYSYHAFWKLRCSFLIPIVKGEKPLIARASEVAMFGREIGDTSQIIEASECFTPAGDIFRGFAVDLWMAEIRLRPLAKIMREKSRIQTLGEELKTLKHATGYENNKMLGLYNQMVNIKMYAETSWFNHIIMIRLAKESDAALTGLLCKYIKDPVKLFTAVAKILGNSPNVISAEIPHRIAKMSRLIKAKGPKAVEEFEQMSTEQAVEYLEKEDVELSKEFATFLDRFGHRCYNEFELWEKSWQENKGAIVDMLKKNCCYADVLEEKKRLSIDEIIKSLDLNLSSKDEFILKKLIAPKSQARVSMRETTKDIYVEYCDMERRASRMMAAELRRNLRIPDDDLFYYFFYDELEPLIREPQPALVAQAIRRRNMFKIFKETWKFPEIIPGWDIVPDHLRPSKELDAEIANAPKLHGTPASSGRVQAKVCLIKGYEEIGKMKAGTILVTYSTDIAFSPIYVLASGYITEKGGLISHGAVVAREFGLPSILGIPDVTRILEDGEEIILDADNGVIVRLEKSEKQNSH